MRLSHVAGNEYMCVCARALREKEKVACAKSVKCIIVKKKTVF